MNRLLAISISIFGLTGCSSPAPPTIRSTFDADIEGWNVQGFNTDQMDFTINSNWIKPGLLDAAGGASGGALQRHDFFLGVGEYFQAPQKFLGDLSAYYGANLDFKLRESHTDGPFAAPLVLLEGAGHRWRYDGSDPPALDWTSYSVPLAAGPGWTSLDGGGASTADAFQATLGAVTMIDLRGEFSNSIDDSWLDDVALGF